MYVIIYVIIANNLQKHPQFTFTYITAKSLSVAWMIFTVFVFCVCVSVCVWTHLDPRQQVVLCHRLSSSSLTEIFGFFLSPLLRLFLPLIILHSIWEQKKTFKHLVLMKGSELLWGCHSPHHSSPEQRQIERERASQTAGCREWERLLWGKGSHLQLYKALEAGRGTDWQHSHAPADSGKPRGLTHRHNSTQLTITHLGWKTHRQFFFFFTGYLLFCDIIIEGCYNLATSVVTITFDMIA